MAGPSLESVLLMQKSSPYSAICWTMPSKLLSKSKFPANVSSALLVKALAARLSFRKRTICLLRRSLKTICRWPPNRTSATTVSAQKASAWFAKNTKGTAPWTWWRIFSRCGLYSRWWMVKRKKCKDAWKSERYYPLFCIQLDTDCIFHDDITAASALHSLGLGNVFPTS